MRAASTAPTASLAIDGLANRSADHGANHGRAAAVCGLLADGCAPPYRNHLRAEASARCEASAGATGGVRRGGGRRLPIPRRSAAAAAHAAAHAAVCGSRLKRLAPPPLPT